MTQGYFDGDDWRDPIRRDEVNGKRYRPFDRRLWLSLEMGFQWCPNCALFVNEWLELKYGDVNKPMWPIRLETLELNVSTATFQMAVYKVVQRARESGVKRKP